MKDEEFIRYCAEVMGYKWGVWAASIMPGNNETWEGYKDNEGYQVNMRAADNLNQMSNVFDKLWAESISWPNEKRHRTQSNFHLSRGIAQAMRGFIESTKS